MARILPLIFLLTAVAPFILPAQMDPGLAAQLQQELDNAVANGEVIGIAAAVNLADQTIWEGASGWATPEVQMNTDQLFFAASNSKTFIAATILQLEEEGLLSLSDEIGNYLALPSEYIAESITIRQLLNHSSGIYNYTDNPAFWNTVNTHPSEFISPQNILENYLKPPAFIPGTDWQYSNTNYILLGQLIEAITGQELAHILRKRFFIPLGLKHTSLGGYEMTDGTIGGIWQDINADDQLEDLSRFPMTALLSGAWAAGGVVSEPRDLSRWVKILYSGEILSDSSLRKMTEITPGSKNGNSFYGLGTIGFSFLNSDFLGHEGSLLHTSAMYYAPAEDISIVVLLNHGGYNFAALLNMISIVKNYTPTANAPHSNNQLAINTYPNPFTDRITIDFQLSSKNTVSLQVYNAQGQAVKFFPEKELTGGSHQLYWDGTNQSGKRVPGGMYLLKIQVGKAYQSRMVILNH